MPCDWYDCFAKLAEHEEEGTAFRVREHDRGSETLIMAPHGGRIEPGTSEIALAVSGEDISVYLFEGLQKGRKHCELHITSHKFDEPTALKMVGQARQVIAIHGRKDGADPETTLVGGLDSEVGARVVSQLKGAGFLAARHTQGKMAAQDPKNICNRSAAGKGVQLEIPRSIRNRLIRENSALRQFAAAVRSAV